MQADSSTTASTGRPTLAVIITSTRPGRVGLPVGEWFIEQAEADGTFDVQKVDLAELDLPFMDEPNHPRMRQYTKDYTKAWSAIVDAADAFVFVMPEYNYSMTAPFKNAIDFLFHEWGHKPVGFVSYGGMSGGIRAVQMAKQVVTTLSMMPLSAAVTIPFVAKLIDEKGRFVPDEQVTASANALLGGPMGQGPCSAARKLTDRFIRTLGPRYPELRYPGARFVGPPPQR